MSNEQKKKYIKPETTILEMDYEGTLLEDSCTAPGGICVDWDDSEDPDDSSDDSSGS